MKKLVAIVLCFVLLCVMIPVVYAEEEQDLFAFLYAYSGTDRGTVLVLQMSDCVIGIAEDSFSVRQQRLENGEEQFGFDVDPNNISIVPPCAENNNRWEVYLFDFVLQLCDYVRVKGLLTQDGERTLTQQVWNGGKLFSISDKLSNLLFKIGLNDWRIGLVDFLWKDNSVVLTGNMTEHTKGLDLLSLEEGKDVCCMQGDLLYPQQNGSAVQTSVRLTAEGDLLTQQEDGSFKAEALGDCTVCTELFGGIRYTWTVHVLTEKDYKDRCVEAVKKHPITCLQTYLMVIALFLSFPPLGILTPIVIPLAMLTSPAAYLGLLVWTRFFM